MRIPVIAGNWKMNKNIREATDFVRDLAKELGPLNDRVCIVCPAFTALSYVAQSLTDLPIQLGGQNLSWESSGAYTGEISGKMLKDAGCKYVIIGHSERRKILLEDDAMINRKVKKALSDGLLPIVCVGETLEEREKGVTFDVVRSQVVKDLEGLKANDVLQCVLAYEPVWAIGTGRNATPAQAQEVHAFIRKILGEQFGPDTAREIRIQYGGSVKPDNIDELMREEDIDGALVGGASLEVKSFSRIVNFRKS